MTRDEATKIFNEYTKRNHKILLKLSQETRPLIAVLQDAGRSRSAEPLNALFFELDALEQELKEAFLNYPDEAILRVAKALKLTNE